MVVLRDGRKIIGTMRSFDQFANVVLEHALERVIVGKKFADVPLGLYVIRGENVVLLGQMVRWLPWPGRARAVPQPARMQFRRASRALEGPMTHILRELGAPPPPMTASAPRRPLLGAAPPGQ
jgi:small nuclear ribonucleoprotein (snRNP)-like protein